MKKFKTLLKNYKNWNLAKWNNLSACNENDILEHSEILIIKKSIWSYQNEHIILIIIFRAGGRNKKNRTKIYCVSWSNKFMNRRILQILL